MKTNAKVPFQHLLFTSKRLERLRARISSDPVVASHWEQFRAKTEQLLATQWTDEAAAMGASSMGGNPQHGNYMKPARELADLVQSFSLLYLIESDERYAEKICSGLLHYSRYQHWSGPGIRSGNPPWRSELVTASFCLAFALGYDLLKERLTKEERGLITTALVDRGILPILQDWIFPETRIHALDSMGHNWWIVCVAMGGVGAVALLEDHPRAAEWVREIEKSVPEFFAYSGNILQNKPVNFDAGGAFYEGVNYSNYALMEYLIYRTVLLDALPDYQPADCAPLHLAEQFFLHTFYPAHDGFLMVNFGDHKIADTGTKAMRLLLANGFATPAGQWYVERTVDDPAYHLGLLLDERVKPPGDLPTSALFPDASWAVMRSGWEDNATLLAARSGTFWNHCHADSGSFILFHAGRPLIIDSGTCDYGRPEYGRYYVTSGAHNVVLVNGQGALQEDFLRGSKFPGKMHSLLDDAGLKYVYADATGPMAHLLSRNYRHWVWVDGAIIIFDDLLAHQPANFNWLLHYAGSAEQKGQDVLIRNGQAEARVQVLYPGQLHAAQPAAPGPDDPDKQVQYLDFSTPQAARQQNFLTAITPLSTSGSPPPKIEFIQGADWLGVRILGQETTTDVYFNLLADGRRMHANSNAVLEGWETDAYLLAVSRPNEAPAGDPAQLCRLLVINGSYVRRENVSVLDSLSKVDALLIPEAKRPRITIHGQPLIQLGLRHMTTPDEVVLNGGPVRFEYSPETREIRLKATCKPPGAQTTG